MKNRNICTILCLAIGGLLIVGCSKNDDSPSSSSSNSDPFEGINKRDMVSITGGTYNQQSDENGDGDVLDTNESFSHTITGFQMAKYEVTYELWHKVYQWAITNGYTFANAGIEGIDGTVGAEPTVAKYEPVTTINWRDAMVWCNAYSQMAGFTPCYTYSSSVIKDSRDSNATACDGAVCSWSANGYRLPSEGEWQFAASDRGATPYNYASGAAADYNNATETQKVAWYYANFGLTKDVGTTTNSSALTLWDVSGNVGEWCWDRYEAYPGAITDYRGPASGSYRMHRGGGCINSADYLQVGSRKNSLPVNEFSFIGFRIARTL